MSATVKSYHQIHLGERRIIERLYTNGFNASRIARQIFRSRSTVMREIKRNGYALPDGRWQYSAERAQKRYVIRMRIAPKRKWNSLPINEKREGKAYYLHLNSYIIEKRKTAYTRLLFRRQKWKKHLSEPLISWHESWQSKDWRSWYNSRRRKRCYSWEELGRKAKRFRKRSTFTVYKRLELPRLQLMASFLQRRKSRKDDRHRHRPAYLRFQKRWWESEPIRLSRRRADAYSELFHPPLETASPPKQETSGSLPILIILPSPVPTVFLLLNGTTMSIAPQNMHFSKIPSLFPRGSPRLFLRSA